MPRVQSTDPEGRRKRDGWHKNIVAFVSSCDRAAAGLSLLRSLCPQPFISSVSPKSAVAGGNAFLLTDGSDFRPDSVVSWNGSFRVPALVSGQQLMVAITAGDIAQPGTVLISVFNPPGGGTTIVSGAIGVMSVTPCSGKNSNPVSFAINP